MSTNDKSRTAVFAAAQKRERRCGNCIYFHLNDDVEEDGSCANLDQGRGFVDADDECEFHSTTHDAAKCLHCSDHEGCETIAPQEVAQ